MPTGAFERLKCQRATKKISHQTCTGHHHYLRPPHCATTTKCIHHFQVQIYSPVQYFNLKNYPTSFLLVLLLIQLDSKSNPSAPPWSYHRSRRRSGYRALVLSCNNIILDLQASRNLCLPVIDQSDMAALKALKSTNSSPTSMGMGKMAR